MGGCGIFILVRKTLTMLRISFHMTMKAVRVFGIKLNSSMSKLLNIVSFYKPPKSWSRSLTLMNSYIGITLRKYKHITNILYNIILYII